MRVKHILYGVGGLLVWQMFESIALLVTDGLDGNWWSFAFRIVSVTVGIALMIGMLRTARTMAQRHGINLDMIDQQVGDLTGPRMSRATIEPVPLESELVGQLRLCSLEAACILEDGHNGDCCRIQEVSGAE